MKTPDLLGKHHGCIIQTVVCTRITIKLIPAPLSLPLHLGLHSHFLGRLTHRWSSKLVHHPFQQGMKPSLTLLFIKRRPSYREPLGLSPGYEPHRESRGWLLPASHHRGHAARHFDKPFRKSSLDPSTSVHVARVRQSCSSRSSSSRCCLSIGRT